MSAPSSSLRNQLRSRVEKLFADPPGSINLERRNGTWRLRWRERDAADGRIRRRSLDLAQDAWLLSEARELLRRRKEAARRDAGQQEAGRALAALKNRVQAASGCGRLLRKRIVRVYDHAAVLGVDSLEDFIRHQPWLARAMPAGRPAKIARHIARLSLLIAALLFCL